MRVAAVDVGTNSVRLLVADVDGGLGWVERDAVVTRLGEGVDASGRLGPAAVARTAAEVGGQVGRARALRAERVRVMATSAARDAANRDELVAAVAQRAGVELEVLTGEEEAALAFDGAVTGLDAPRPALMLDIGGGSTELVLGDDAPTAATSRQLGCVRLTERAMGADPPDAAEVAAARALVDAELDRAAEEVDLAGAAALVAVAGTATTLAALHLGLPAYDAAAIHGTTLAADDLAALVAWLEGAAAAEVAARGPVMPGREDVLLAGALVLEGVLARTGLDAATVSEQDLLDAACRGLAAG